MNDKEVQAIISEIFYFLDDKCGYCGGNKEDEDPYRNPDGDMKLKSRTIGFSAHQMGCSEYFYYMNRGFRRSGKFIYKPDLFRNCCRLYTIRTNISMMKVTKQHRKVINRFVQAIGPEEGITTTQKKTNAPFDISKLIDAEVGSKKFYSEFQPSEFSIAKFELYKKYQVAIHNDKEEKVTEKGFKRFLCDSPFPRHSSGSISELQNWKKGNGICHYEGPVHECYYFDGKLIAISVLDILPGGISSVYFIWDPDYAHLSLGTLSALREILMCQKLGLEHYYLGYFVEDCPKMKYKAAYGGELLDLSSNKYYPMELLKNYINDGDFFILSEGNVFDQEPLLDEGKGPLSLTMLDLKNNSLRNISHEIYSSDSIAQSAKANYLAVQKMLEINDSLEELSLPLVIPGVLPMNQLLNYCNDGSISMTMPVYHIDIQHGFQVNRLYELRSEQRSSFINSIRVLGLQHAITSIMII